jgi:uncharacterized membrane protein HdeD (DUF308 family)
MAERLSQAAIDAGVAETRQQMRDAVDRVHAEVAHHWVWYLILGIVLIVAGMAAIAFPQLSTIAVKALLGWVFLFAGGAMIVHAFTVGEWRGFFANLLIGILYVAGGGVLAFVPLAGLLAITLLIAALFIADGVLEIAAAMRIKPHRAWGWVMVSGIVALVAGLLIALQLPSSAGWVLGLLAGIKLIFAGWSFVALSLGESSPRAPLPSAL